jgi:hypothetical protein
VDGSQSVARGTTIRHSLVILNAAVGQVGARVGHALAGGRGGVLGAGKKDSSMVTREFFTFIGIDHCMIME